MNRNFIALAFAAAATPLWAVDFTEAFPADSKSYPEMAELMKGLDFQQGEVTIGNGLATLSVSQDYYYLNPTDTAFVLEQIWGNPPGDPVLGMIFPAEASPLADRGWGMTVWFEPIGYVDDKDAADQDYDAILADLQAETRAESEWRVENGYQTVTLVGWAEAPYYDADQRVVYWAQDLLFGSSPDHQLNFNMRTLGRKGVLVQNFIAGMDDLQMVKDDLPDVIAMTNFNEGNRYGDFNPSIDTVAAVGVGGLVAGKVLAKSGFLAVALLFLKKFWFVVLLPLVWLKNLFTGRKES